MSELKFENTSFRVEAEKESGCRLSVKIEVKPDWTQKVYKKAVKLVNKQISIPGFRKGHAPDATVISRYTNYVEREWKEMLVNDAYRAALDFIKIYPLSKESIQKPQIESLSQEEGAVIKIVYEYYPTVPTIDFSEITLPKLQREEVTEDKVEEVLQEVRRGQAGWEDIQGRPVQEGDFVDVTIEAIDQDPPKPIVKDRRFEVKEKRMARWLMDLLIGLEIGETRQGTSEVDEHADENVRKNFKPTEVRITLHAIKKIELPEVNEELAKKVGAASVDDLHSKIYQNLEKRAEDELYYKRLQALDEALLEKYVFEVPASLVDEERRQRMKSMIQALKEENLSDEEIRAKEKAIEHQVTREVDHFLRLYFLNKQIAKQGNISLTNQELNDEIVRELSQNPQRYGKEMDKEKTKEFVSQMASIMMQRKAKNYALSQVLQH